MALKDEWSMAETLEALTPSPVVPASVEPAFALISMAAAERVLWIDLEMTDISDVARGRIMEVGAIVTGSSMEWLPSDEERGICTMYHRVVRLTAEELAASSEWSKANHSRPRPSSGMSLMELCEHSSFALSEIEEDLISLVRIHGKGRPMMLAGSSVGCDRIFIDKHMPRLSSVLHHRNIDVSTILELCRRMYSGFRIRLPSQPAHTQHTAMGDIISSLRLMHFLQSTVFMPVLLPADPGSDDGSAAGTRPSGLGFPQTTYGPPHQHHHHHLYGPAEGSPYANAGAPRGLLVRQAPPMHFTMPPPRGQMYASNALLMATASHGFPLQRRHGW
jgi:oligoribonuclease